MGVWGAPGRSRNRGKFVVFVGPVAGSWIHRSGVLDWAGGEESGNPAEKADLGDKEV